jgi:hypothetical protein
MAALLRGKAERYRTTGEFKIHIKSDSPTSDTHNMCNDRFMSNNIVYILIILSSILMDTLYATL